MGHNLKELASVFNFRDILDGPGKQMCLSVSVLWWDII